MFQQFFYILRRKEKPRWPRDLDVPCAHGSHAHDKTKHLLPMPLCNFTRRKTLYEAKPNLMELSLWVLLECSNVSETEALGLPGCAPSMHSSHRNINHKDSRRAKVLMQFEVSTEKTTSKRTNTTPSDRPEAKPSHIPEGARWSSLKEHCSTGVKN